MVLTWVSEPCRMAAVTAVSGNVFVTLRDKRHDQSARWIAGHRSQHMIVASIHQSTGNRIGDGSQSIVGRHCPVRESHRFFHIVYLTRFFIVHVSLNIVYI